jgi:hypothetical protein
MNLTKQSELALKSTIDTLHMGEVQRVLRKPVKAKLGGSNFFFTRRRIL